MAHIHYPFDQIMKKLRAHVFVCTNERAPEDRRGCCKAKGSEEVLLRFKEGLAQAGLKGEIRAQKAGCLDVCEQGASVVIYPEGVWYGNVEPKDVEEILSSHLQ